MFCTFDFLGVCVCVGIERYSAMRLRKVEFWPNFLIHKNDDDNILAFLTIYARHLWTGK